jgi:dynein light chain LC8-type
MSLAPESSTSSLPVESEKPRTHRITIKSIDMPDDKKDAVIAMAEEALEKMDMEKDMAESLKRQCDTAYGNTWHCVVGKK